MYSNYNKDKNYRNRILESYFDELLKMKSTLGLSISEYNAYLDISKFMCNKIS